MTSIDALIARLAPEGVPHVAVGEAVSVVPTPRTIKRQDYAKGSLVPVVDQGQALIAGYTDDRTAAIAKGEHIVFGDHTRAVKWVDFEFAPGADGTKVIRAGDNLLPKYLYQALRNLDIPSRGYNRHWTVVRDLRIPVPPLEVQQEVVRFLGHFAELEAELEAALEAELEARRREFSFHRDQVMTFADAAGVRRVPISELVGAGFFRDGDWVESKDQDPTGEVRLTQLADVGIGVFRDRSDRRMREDQAARLGCTFLEPGDLLIARMPDPLGRVCQVPKNIGRAVTVVDVAVLRVRSDGVMPRYVMHAINSDTVSRKILSFQAGGTRQRISRTNLGSVEIPLPPITEQHRIVEILDQLGALEDDLSVALPAEVKARRAQFEYYRSQLLTFPEAPA